MHSHHPPGRLAGFGLRQGDDHWAAAVAGLSSLARISLNPGANRSFMHQSLGEIHPPPGQARIENGMAVPATRYIQAQTLRRDLRRELLEAVEPYDAILTPATLAPAPDTSTTGNPHCQWLWTTVGFPAISIPSGLSSDGLPLGLQLASAPLDEPTLLATAAWCEQVLDVHLTPPV